MLLQPAQKIIFPPDFPERGENADTLGVVAIIGLFVLTHHRPKATIDNCLTTENSADCNFPPETFLYTGKFKLLLLKTKMIYVIKILLLYWGGRWNQLTSHMIKTLQESFWLKFLDSESLQCKSRWCHASFKSHIQSFTCNDEMYER